MKKSFIDKIKNGAIAGHKKYGVLPSLTISQAILETGWGKASIGNNIFGIKANASWKGKTQVVRTHEFINGKKIYVDAKFRDYNSIEESLEDRFRLLSNSRYKKVVQAKNYKEGAKELYKAGYATDPQYANKLIRIIEQNKLYEFDSQIKEVISVNMIFPVEDKHLSKCRFSSPYGSRIHPIRKTPDGHRAIDIAMPINTPLRAIDRGRVLYNRVNSGGPSKGYGYYLVIDYDNGYSSLYAHLVNRSSLKEGATVNKGQIVAYSGNTGSSTGPHLHFETHKNGFHFRSQIKNADSAIDPVTLYPQLKGKLGQYLGNIKFSSSAINKPIKKEVGIVEFKEKWKDDLLIDSIIKLEKKGVINDGDYWLTRFKNKTLTTSELGLLALVAAERSK